MNRSGTTHNGSGKAAAAAAWALAGSWTALIWLTIPFARTLQGLVERRAGGGAYGLAAAAGGILAGLAALVWVWWPPRRQPGARTAWLVALGGVSAWIFRGQLQVPVEALHLFEYGVLGLLLFRAWRHPVRDPLVYPIAAWSLALVAWADEFFQWLVPGRFWDYRDIRLNVLAGAAALVFAGRVIRPSGIRLPVARRSVRWLCRLSWVLLAALGLSVSCTPHRVDALAGRVPFLRFLYNNESTMTEYGWRHRDPDMGVFNSRLTLPELRYNDETRGEATGERLGQWQRRADSRKVREMFPPTADPFLHEAAVHLARRDRYYATAWQHRETDRPRFVFHLTVALRENQILERYFPQTLETAGGRWPAERVAPCADQADLAAPYASEVAGHLMTAAAERQLWGLLLALAAATGWGYARWGREPVLRA